MKTVSIPAHPLCVARTTFPNWQGKATTAPGDFPVVLEMHDGGTVVLSMTPQAPHVARRYQVRYCLEVTRHSSLDDALAAFHGSVAHSKSLGAISRTLDVD